MSSSVQVGHFTGNQVRLTKMLGMNLRGLARADLDTRDLRIEERRRALDRKELREGSKVLYPGIEIPLFIAEIDYQGGCILLSSRDPSDLKPKNIYPIWVRVSIRKFLRNFKSRFPDSEDGGKTWA